MKYIFTILLFCILFIGKSMAQETKILKGFVRNAEKQTLSFTIIFNLNTQKSITANEFGAFQLMASIGDSLLVSRLAYKTDTFIVSKAIFYEIKPFDIFLKRKENLLKDIKVNSRYRNDSIAEAYANLMKHDTLLNNNNRAKNMKQMSKISDITFISSGGIAVTGLINKVWYHLSDKGKSNEKLLQIITLYNKNIEIDDRVPLDLVEKVTGLSSIKAQFLKQNCIKNKLLLLSNYNDYDLIQIIKKCAEE
jgi:hypothetical protein